MAIPEPGQARSDGDCKHEVVVVTASHILDRPDRSLHLAFLVFGK